MTYQNTGWTPFGACAVVASAWLDATKAAQDAVTQSLDRAAHAERKTVDWVGFEVPVPSSNMMLMDEEQMRDQFHRLADMNLRGWEVAANMLQALPGWANWPSQAPGTMMTDWFDRMRRASVSAMPANDSFAMPQAFTAPAFWAAATASASGPELLDAPDGEPDDLTQIKGIGPKLSDMLNEVGIYHYRQIAAWSEADGEWIDDKLAFKGRVAREEWVAQASALAEQAAA